MRTISAAAVTLSTLTLGLQVACGLTCEERADYAASYIEDIVEVNRRCSWDDDCINVTILTQCGNLCTQAVNVDGVANIEAAVEHVNEAWCDESAEMGCGFDTPSCDPLDRARCEQGLCVNGPM